MALLSYICQRLVPNDSLLPYSAIFDQGVDTAANEREGDPGAALDAALLK